jgi:hypothetical protein
MNGHVFVVRKICEEAGKPVDHRGFVRYGEGREGERQKRKEEKGREREREIKREREKQ